MIIVLSQYSQPATTDWKGLVLQIWGLPVFVHLGGRLFSADQRILSFSHNHYMQIQSWGDSWSRSSFSRHIAFKICNNFSDIFNKCVSKWLPSKVYEVWRCAHGSEYCIFQIICCHKKLMLFHSLLRGCLCQQTVLWEPGTNTLLLIISSQSIGF